jgi:myo-inositol-1(or 4)-monophosphatase
MFARGLIDVYIDLREKIRVTDMAAGYLLVNEAGGFVLDPDLEPLDSDLGFETKLSFIAAANKKILDEIVSQIKK